MKSRRGDEIVRQRLRIKPQGANQTRQDRGLAAWKVGGARIASAHMRSQRAAQAAGVDVIRKRIEIAFRRVCVLCDHISGPTHQRFAFPRSADHRRRHPFAEHGIASRFFVEILPEA